MGTRWQNGSQPLHDLFRISIQEVTIMNFHLSHHPNNEVLQSVGLFIVMLAFISLLGVIFLAAV